MGHGRIGAAAMLCAILATAPASAQQVVSDSYSFLKAVRDRDGTKVQEYLDRPNSDSVSARERDTGETALHIVVKRRDLPYAQVMVARGADTNARDAQGMTPLADAAQIGWEDGTQLLLAHGARPDLADSRGETPLILATQGHNLAVARMLVDAGANPRATDNVTGMSAIDYARRDGRSEALLKMLESVQAKPKREVAGPHP